MPKQDAALGWGLQRPAMAPAMRRAPLRDAGWTALGAGLGLALGGWLVPSPHVDPVRGLYLVAPLGTSAVLMFGAPNRPLA